MEKRMLLSSVHVMLATIAAQIVEFYQIDVVTALGPL